MEIFILVSKKKKKKKAKSFFLIPFFPYIFLATLQWLTELVTAHVTRILQIQMKHLQTDN